MIHLVVGAEFVAKNIRSVRDRKSDIDVEKASEAGDMMLLTVALAALAGVANAAPLRIDGLIAAVVSPFTSDGMSLNISVVREQASYLQVEQDSLVTYYNTAHESSLGHWGSKCLRGGNYGGVSLDDDR